jgi:hypothetical protein
MWSIGLEKVCARGYRYQAKEVVYGSWTKLLESIWGFGGGDKDEKLRQLKGWMWNGQPKL